MKIKHIKSLQIIDSRGNPTVETEVILDNAVQGRAAAPSGASTGVREAVELRDKDERHYLGRGVLQAVNNVNTEIANHLIGAEASLSLVDEMMIKLDGTQDKGRLGANAILSVSLALAKAISNSNQVGLYAHIANEKSLKPSLPVPMMNILNGGAHADNALDIQEFMILPVGFERFSDSLRSGVEIFHHLKAILNQKKLSTGIGDEGGFAPDLNSNEEALELILSAIESAGYIPGKQVFLGLDVASSEFFIDGTYTLNSENKQFNSSEFVSYLANLIGKYPIISIEDGMSEDDWDGWKKLSDAYKDQVQLVGDDLFVTNPAILKKGIDMDIGNSILIKPNQIGTLTETLDAIELATQNQYSSVVSHRSGETEDTTIADIAVGTSATQIKTGSLCRSDRLAKYNQLLRIEAELGADAK
ncbi:MAG: phosphopyruvate hydratase, partial [Proteobacteria bacterium]|nr:phosphopyruvate hydratase [Pseudomonadota bacterium]